MSDYRSIFCAACRVLVLSPTVYDGFGNEHYVSPGRPWIREPDRDGSDLWFCSEECRDKGRAQPVREPVEAHVDWERGSKPHPERSRGRWDALLGYDCIGTRPEYVKGHGEGMAMREIIKAAVMKMKEGRA